jgi:hypothetical protein
MGKCSVGWSEAWKEEVLQSPLLAGVCLAQRLAYRFVNTALWCKVHRAPSELGASLN